MDKDATFIVDSDSDGGDIEVPISSITLISNVESHPSVTITSDDTKPTEFGRKPECSPPTRFSDSRISKLHCKVFIEGNPPKLYVQDLSSNGTFINGVKLGKGKIMMLKDADVLALSKGIDGLPSYIVKYEATDNKDDNTEDQAPILAQSSDSPAGGKRTAETVAESPDVKRQNTGQNDGDPGADLEENLTCGICHDIMHQVVSCQPCLHSFCGGCYSGWSKRSRQCPQCRAPVNMVSRNHIITNLVDAYLRLHPEKKRSEEELSELENGNLYTTDRAPPVPPTDSMYDEDADEENYFSDDDSSSDEDELEICRQCPGQPDATDNYQCANPNPIHLYCRACTLPVPDRTDPIYRPIQRCGFCFTVYCDLYYTQTSTSGGCPAPGGQNALKPLEQYEFHAIPPNSFSNNTYEQEVLREYLADLRLPVQTVFSAGLDRLRDGRYILSWAFGKVYAERHDGNSGEGDDTAGSAPLHGAQTDGTLGVVQGNGVGGQSSSNAMGNLAAALVPTIPVRTTITPTSITCRYCAEHIFSELCYLYREELQVDVLPAAVTGRPDCWYGRECRTQSHNRSHAVRLNHICPQTRF